MCFRLITFVRFTSDNMLMRIVVILKELDLETEKEKANNQK